MLVFDYLVFGLLLFWEVLLILEVFPFLLSVLAKQGLGFDSMGCFVFMPKVLSLKRTCLECF
jgi:hypothetical protein